jgi:hypothetical protein
MAGEVGSAVLLAMAFCLLFVCLRCGRRPREARLHDEPARRDWAVPVLNTAEAELELELVARGEDRHKPWKEAEVELELELVARGEDRRRPWKEAVAAALLKQPPHRSRSPRR